MSAAVDRIAAEVETALLARGARRNGDKLTFSCPMPAHEDGNPSAYYNVLKRVWSCKGCGAMGGLVRGNHPIAPLLGIENGHQRRRIGTRRYAIRDRGGVVHAYHLRHDFDDQDKTFAWEGPGGEKDLGGRAVSTLPLYATEKLVAREPGDDSPIFVTEGEKAAEALLELGLMALGTVTGASGTPGAEVLEVLRDRDMVLWPDADTDGKGQDHMQRIAAALAGVAQRVRIFAPEGLSPKGDAFEWLAIHRGIDVVAKLLNAVEVEAVEQDVQHQDHHHDDQREPQGEVQDTPSRSSWAPIDLSGILAGNVEAERPSVLEMVGGACLLYAGRVNSIHGETESFKSWLALLACRQELNAGNVALYLDYEDNAVSIAARLRALGVPDQVILDQFRYVQPMERFAGAAVEEIEAVLALSPALAVVDGMTDAMVLEGLSIKENDDVSTFYQRLPRWIARRGSAVLTIDHVTKSQEHRGRFAIGAQAKLAGIDGAAYSVTMKQPFGRGKTGRAHLHLAKDKHGSITWEGGQRLVADVEAVSDGQAVVLTLQAPVSVADFRPTYLMERVSKALEEQQNGVSGKWITKNVKGKATGILTAIEVLVREKYVKQTPTAQGQLYRSIRAYREAFEKRGTGDGDD